MDLKKYITPEIKLSVIEEDLFETDILFEAHLLVWILEGEMKVIQAGATNVFKGGDIYLLPRNQAATVVTYPKNGKPNRSVAMLLTLDRLREFYSKIEPQGKPMHIEKVYLFKGHPLLQSCLSSLMPYFEMEGKFPEKIASLKLTEVLTILRTIDPNMDMFLANFEVPGKIDLVKFMEKNFMFNLTLEKFGYLSGRSLSTFNRDFRKTFNTNPQKWLTRKRLELAHWQITELAKKPVDVYLEVGFEDLSHFSFAFKKHFGYIPTTLVRK